MLTAARFAALGRRWWDLRELNWPVFAIGLLLNVAVSLGVESLKPLFPAATGQMLGIILGIATLPLLLYTVAGLLGDRSASLRTAFTSGWKRVPLLLVLLVAAYVPAFIVHVVLNRFAIGLPLALVAPMLVVDSLVVGLLATLVGTALGRALIAPPRSNDRPAAPAAA